jgi:hypothetical protein
MLRHKTILQQVRTQCANDIRKRDVQIQKLKGHIANASQQRGTRTPLSTTTIVVTPGSNNGGTREERNTPSVESDMYDLRQETTEFLTQLSQSLSDENDNLIGLVRSTIATLQSLQGLPLSSSGSGSNDLADEVEQGIASSNLLLTLPTSYDTLATEMDSVLEHLRTLLTNPSFVPLEEVEVREEEIIRLREGWEKMEGRWRDAVKLMEGWRKRMAKGGGAVNLEDVEEGLRLSPVKDGQVQLDDIEEGDEDVDALDQDDILEDVEEEDIDIDQLEEVSDSEPPKDPENPPVALGETSGNSARSPPKRHVAFTRPSSNSLSTSSVGSSEKDEIDLLPATSGCDPQPTRQHPPQAKPSQERPKSRIPQTVNTSRSRLNTATIARKLAATASEAEAARIRSQAKKTQRKTEVAARDAKKDKVTENPRKRKTISGGMKPSGRATSRRRSTLSPWELEDLILGGEGATTQS